MGRAKICAVRLQEAHHHDRRQPDEAAVPVPCLPHRQRVGGSAAESVSSMPTCERLLRTTDSVWEACLESDTGGVNPAAQKLANRLADTNLAGAGRDAACHASQQHGLSR